MRQPAWTVVVALGALAIGDAVATAGEAPPITIAPSDPHLRFSGRWDRRDAAGPRCAWSACAVRWRMRGAAVDALLAGKAKGELAVVVDGAPTGVVVIADGVDRYPLAAGLGAGEHTVELWKRTEAFFGIVQLQGLVLPAGAALVDLPVAKRRIEFIGDSITAGYGDEAASKDEPFSTTNENAWLAFGPAAARLLHADVAVEAWSGIRLMANGGDEPMPKRWERTLPLDPGSVWQPGDWQPDAVVVDLGTNDANRPIDEAAWDDAYRAFIARIRLAYPQTHVFLAIGPMSYGPNDCIPAYDERLAAAYAKAGDARVHALKLPLQRPEDGVGSNWHPNAKTHALMAGVVADAVRSELRW